MPPTEPEAPPPTSPEGALPENPPAGSPEASHVSSLPGTVVTPVSRTVCLHRPAGTFADSQPLVLLLPWFGARPGALAKYLSLYLGRGWAVLVAESSLGHFLWPRWGLAYAEQLLGLLGEGKALGTQPLLIHAFSIGGYTFAQMMVHLARHPERHAGVRERIRGCVYDSLVAGSLENMAQGVARMTSSSAAVRPLLRGGALLYFRLFRPCTVAHYEAALGAFHHPPVGCPVLVFFCRNDPLSDARAMEQLLAAWRALGIRVQVQEWPVSRHAQHLRLYPQEYTRAVGAFLQQLGLPPASGLQAKL
ncbi:transmembrane protein 53 [Zootoca vivipara]|uniref:transmembrane protein 53 n=1 Tax=Zootoca vivipara TaxID=8524 RepID=UPI00293C0936|nr:transmembrane protein 53 [Zootoca vivipara]XP_060135350.1 transmembrane protein 53 [Zootoca vivipara]XP_060135351.1 transmembrane protein 53 [Zootoca vivipara]XP_060135352.1 transmembrane protein 53 [Zootoca vivipara]